MNNQRAFPLAFSFVLCLCLLAALLAIAGSPGHAQGSTLYVAPGGGCGGVSPCYATVQQAVDAAGSGDVIKVAAGTYTDIHARNSVTQVVYIDETVAIQGGYTLTNWTVPDPINQPAILDAQRQGRVLYITGEISPTVEGLHITGGDAAGLGGGSWGGDAGGGVFVVTATALISGNRILDNISRDGGGLALVSSRSVVIDNTFAHNLAVDNISVFGWGGGLLAYRSPGARIEANTFYSNTATCWGGGLLPAYIDGITITNNTIISNTAGQGAGVFLLDSNTVLAGNLIAHNHGGDVVLLYYNNNTIVDGNVIRDNHGTALNMRGTHATFSNNTIAANQGNGFFIMQSDVTLINNVIVDTVEPYRGAVHIYGSTASLVHNTIARTSGPGVAVEETAVGNTAVAVLTNTILAGNTTGIQVSAGNTATLQATLWGSNGWANGQDWAGDGAIITGTVNVWGPPAFQDAGSGDYHITAASAALDAGIDAGIAADIDGHPRPMRSGYDIGADELPPVPIAAYTHSAPDWLGQTTVFTNTTVPGAINAYVWAFGDGLTTTLENPGHLYANPGAYTVVLTATNQAGTDATGGVVTVYGPPVAGFDASPTEGIRPLNVIFTNTTTTVPPGDPSLAYLWQFGDGAASSLRDPEHTYTTAGVYTVTLWTANAAGADTLVRTGLVTVYEPVHAEFSAWPVAGEPPLQVTFTNRSTGDYTALLWDFGDGGTSALPNPVHTYVLTGNYTVTLWIDGPGGADLEAKDGYITVGSWYRIYLPLILRSH